MGHFGVWGYFWGYLATSGAKSDVIFLLGKPDFLQKRQNFAAISLSFYPCDAMLAWVYATTFQSVYLCVTFVLCIKTAKRFVKILLPHDSPIILVFHH